MSHYTVTVRLTAERLVRHGGEVQPALAEIMAPYNEQTEDGRYLEFREDDDCDIDEKTGKRGYMRNPNSKWDWYSIGGRWMGFYPVKSNVTPRLGRAGTFHNNAEPGHSDIVKLTDIDFDAIAGETRKRLDEFYAEYEAMLGGKHFPAFEGPRDKALSLGLVTIAREPVKPMDGLVLEPWSKHSHITDERRNWTDVCKRITREELARDYGDSFVPLQTHSALDDTGWHEAGRMGWFGCDTAEPDANRDFDRSFVKRFIRSVGPDDLLVLVDAHI